MKAPCPLIVGRCPRHPQGAFAVIAHVRRVARALCSSSQARMKVALLAVCIMLADGCLAQQLTPRAYWPAPVGTQVLLMGYQYSSGDIITDPTLPIAGVNSQIHYAMLGYQRFFSFLGRTANVQLAAPYSAGTTEGLVRRAFQSVDVRGLGDMTIKGTVNLLGAPAMDGTGMQALRAAPRTQLGLSITVSAPTGEYQPDKVLNVGTNRWAVRPAAGMIWPIRPTWLLEAELGAWFFQDNDDFLGMTRGQDPIWSGELHLIKRFRPGFWASLDVNYYRGGKTTLEGVASENLQRNSRAGATLVVPLGRGAAVKLSYSAGINTASGGDYSLITLQAILVYR